MILADAQATEAAGRALGARLAPGDVIALTGPLGAGKTSLARGILRGLGFAGEVASPTFALVIPYEPPLVRIPLWHADLYRLEAPREAEVLALDDVLDEGALVVEWPDRLAARLLEGALQIAIAADGDARRLTVVRPPSWERRWPFP